MHRKVLKSSALASAVLAAGALSSTAILGVAQAQHPGDGAVHAAKHHRSHKRHHAVSGIPQHNGGDHDSDNNGGPSDGDGNI